MAGLSNKDGIGVYLTYQELMGEEKKCSDMILLLSRLPKDYVLKWLTWLGANLHASTANSVSDQLGISSQLCEETLFEKIKARLSRPNQENEVAFHRQQAWLTMQLALLASPEKVDDFDEKRDIKSFGKCLLFANDVLTSSVEQLRETDLHDTDWIIAKFLPLVEMNRQARGPSDQARAYSIWVNLMQREDVAKRVEKVLKGECIENRFEQYYGLPLSRFLDLLFAVNLLFQEQNEKFLPKVLRKSNLKAVADTNEIDAALNLIAKDPDDIAIELMFTPRQSWESDFGPFRRSPLIRIKDDKEEAYACPDLMLLEKYFETIVFWDIVKAFEGNKNLISQIYGILFEEHAFEVARQFAYEGDELHRQLYLNPRFDSDSSEACDCLIDWCDLVVLIELKSNKLTPHQKYSNSPEILSKAIDDVYAESGKNAKGVGQLAKSIKRIHSGEKIHSGSATLNFAETKKILPVLIIAEPGLSIEAVRSRLDTKLRRFVEGPNTNSLELLPLALLTQYQLESLETYASIKDLKSIMLGYVLSIQNNEQLLFENFTSFLYKNYGSVPNLEPTYMMRMIKCQLDRFKDFLQKADHMS